MCAVVFIFLQFQRVSVQVISAGGGGREHGVGEPMCRLKVTAADASCIYSDFTKTVAVVHTSHERCA